VRRRRVERDLEEELRATFELLVEEKVRAGLQLDDARRAARLELGSLESLKDEVRDARAGAFVDTLLQDVRYALRLFRRAPGFTVVAVVTLALGIGANTAMFSVVDAVLLRPLPYDEPGRVAQVFEAAAPGQRNYVSVGVFSDWVRHNSTFEALAAVGNAELNLTDGGEPERISGLRMSPSGLLVLRARPVLGRTFAPDEDQPGKSTVIVLTHALWRRRFGGDPGVVGRSVRLNGESHTVIGVLPPSFLPWEEREFVVPMVFKPEQLENRGGHWIRVLGRLRPGVSLARAGEDLLAVSRPYRELYPKWKKDWGVTVVPMHEQLTADVKPMLMVLLGAVALVLLIACANVANLLLARASARQKEIAIRLAIGASRGRVVRQLLAESLLLALIGAAGGLALAFAATAAIRQAGVPNLARTHEIAVDWRVLGFAIVVSLVTGLVFGLAPALQASRPDLNGALVDGGRASTGGRNRTRHSLIVSEVALALVLLAGAGLLVNSFARLLNVNPGFEPRRALALQVSLSERKYPDAEQQTRVTERMLERIRSLPGIAAAGATMTLPLTWPPDTLITIPGRQGPHDGSYSCDFDFVAPGYFHALGIPLFRGRLFDERDTAAGARVALVNETFVHTHFPATSGRSWVWSATSACEGWPTGSGRSSTGHSPSLASRTGRWWCERPARRARSSSPSAGRSSPRTPSSRSRTRGASRRSSPLRSRSAVWC